MRNKWFISGFIVLMSLTACVSACKKPLQQKRAYQDQIQIGDLGGMKVNIPPYQGRFIEYDGDPNVFSKEYKDFKAPIRTYDSKISSFGFDIRYPDGALPSTEELMMDQFQQNKNVHTTMWLRAGINAGSTYGIDGQLDYSAKDIMKGPYWFETYERLPKDQFGLMVYALKGIDPKTQLPFKQGLYAKDVFIYQDTKGKTRSYIDCGNTPSIEGGITTCTQSFTLEEHNLKVGVYVGYQRELLPHWKEIQQMVTQRILGFRAP